MCDPYPYHTYQNLSWRLCISLGGSFHLEFSFVFIPPYERKCRVFWGKRIQTRTTKRDVVKSHKHHNTTSTHRANKPLPLSLEVDRTTHLITQRYTTTKPSILLSNNPNTCLSYWCQHLPTISGRSNTIVIYYEQRGSKGQGGHHRHR